MYNLGLCYPFHGILLFVMQFFVCFFLQMWQTALHSVNITDFLNIVMKKEQWSSSIHPSFTSTISFSFEGIFNPLYLLLYISCFSLLSYYYFLISFICLSTHSTPPVLLSLSPPSVHLQLFILLQININ